MRLFAVSMVRNEADVIEAFVRHNLAFLDGLLVTDHDSIDATADILAKLQAEGLPLWLGHCADPVYRQPEVVTTLARQAFSLHAADFVFALDADEFLKVDSRTRLEAALAMMPHGLHGLVRWLTYVPEHLGAVEDGFGPDHLRWRLAREGQGYKAVAARHLLEQPQAYFSLGSHYVALSAETTAAHALLPPDIAYAHCPVRSRSQLAARAVLGYVVSLGSELGPRRARLWTELYHRLRAGTTLTEEQVRDVACNYGLQRKRWQPASSTELVEDPVRLVFEPRYASEARRSSLEDLLRFAERATRGRSD